MIVGPNILFTAHLSGSDVVTVGVGAAASSALQLTVVDLHTHFAVTCPALRAHTRHVTWTCIHTLCLWTERCYWRAALWTCHASGIHQVKKKQHYDCEANVESYVGVAASSVVLQAEVDGRTGVTITFISVIAHTPGSAHTHTGERDLCGLSVRNNWALIKIMTKDECVRSQGFQSCLRAERVHVTVLQQAVSVTRRGLLVAIFSWVPLQTRSSPAHPAAAGTVVAHTVDAAALWASGGDSVQSLGTETKAVLIPHDDHTCVTCYNPEKCLKTSEKPKEGPDSRTSRIKVDVLAKMN